MGVNRGIQKGKAHSLTPVRAAQIHRWQLLGAAARKGKSRGAAAAHGSSAAASRKNVTGTYAKAAKWGVAKLVLPTSLVTGIIPGRQLGDGKAFSGKKRGRR